MPRGRPKKIKTLTQHLDGVQGVSPALSTQETEIQSTGAKEIGAQSTQETGTRSAQETRKPVDILHLAAQKFIVGLGGSIQIIDAKLHNCEIWMSASGIATIECRGYISYLAPGTWHTADVYPKVQSGLTDHSNVAAHTETPQAQHLTTDGELVQAAPASNAMGIYRQRSRYM